MSDTPKRFEGWEKIDCNECGHYWLNQCDGVKKDAEKPCNSYLATRNVDIPARINALEKRVKWLNRSCILIDIVVILHLVSHIVGWYSG